MRYHVKFDRITFDFFEGEIEANSESEAKQLIKENLRLLHSLGFVKTGYELQAQDFEIEEICLPEKEFSELYEFDDPTP